MCDLEICGVNIALKIGHLVQEKRRVEGGTGVLEWVGWSVAFWKGRILKYNCNILRCCFSLPFIQLNHLTGFYNSQSDRHNTAIWHTATLRLNFLHSVIAT
jgi:hypothetical protein